MKHLQTILLFLFLSSTLSAQPFQNMTNLGTWHDPDLQFNRVRYNDVWGYAADGREYGLIGSRQFMHIIDVTDPANATEIVRLNDAGGSSVWRDVKVYDTYAYMVTEAAEGLQVIDLSNLPTSADVVFESTADFSSCHNIFIDTTSTPVKLYAFGTNTSAQRDGIIVYSLANPATPVKLGQSILSGGYAHDGYVINDTLYANQEHRGLFVHDVSDPNNPMELGVLDGYAEEGYNHSCWRSANGKYLAMCDETVDKGVKIVDVEDPLDMEVEGLFRSTLLAPTSTESLAHNPFYLGDSLVVISYYGDGVQVWDVRNPATPRRLAYYDTNPMGTGYTVGVWGTYPYLPSGNILGSDEVTGLYVLKVDNYQSLPVEYLDWQAATDGKHAHLSWSTSSENDNAGWDVEHAVAGGDFVTVDFVPSVNAGDYTFTHEDIGPGRHYYRLNQRDLDGTETLTELRTVLIGNDLATFTAYPNPAPSGAPIRLEGIGDATDWELFRSNGQLALTGRGYTLRADLAAGAYFLRVAGKEVGTLVISR